MGQSPGSPRWRWLLALLTFEDDPPADEGAPWDIVAVILAGVGCAAAFYGASRLESAGPSPSSLVPLIAGVRHAGRARSSISTSSSSR